MRKTLRGWRNIDSLVNKWLTAILTGLQGDRMGRIVSFWVSDYFGLFLKIT
jgi:hypothetical protein